MKEEIYTFNEYILGYGKGNNDRSCLTISKIINGDMYVMSSLYDGSADVISMILDNLQQENKKLKEQYCERTDCSGRLGNSKKVEELEQENKQLKEDISFCLKSIKQEMEMSTDSRTKQEMLSCYQILSKWSDK